jgi:hypothetical protein
VEIERQDLDLMQDKVNIPASDPNRMNPLKEMRTTRNIGNDAASASAFLPPGLGPQDQGPSSSLTSDIPSSDDLNPGDSPANLIFQDPPPFTPLHFTLIFDFS